MFVNVQVSILFSSENFCVVSPDFFSFFRFHQNPTKYLRVNAF